jgi:hypothetical protein
MIDSLLFLEEEGECEPLSSQRKLAPSSATSRLLCRREDWMDEIAGLDYAL